MMMKRRTINDYVCPVCFRKPENCICKCYSMTLILIDEKLQYAIQNLNDIGLVTVDCCQGHFDERIPNMYISFRDNINDCPDEFIIENNKVIRYIYKNYNSRKEFEEEQNHIIKKLNKWVKDKIESR